jgi:hypothetical protein
MFCIHSANSDRELIFSDHRDDYFQVELKGGEIYALRGVWVDTDGNDANVLFQKLAGFQRPWQGAISWESLEGEFSLSATCTPLGQVTLLVILSCDIGTPELWRVEASLVTELGQLERIAKNANAFFQE